MNRQSLPREPRRRHGQGSLYQRNNAWYGQWRSNGRQIKRKLGPVKTDEHRAGLSAKDAETELRRLMVEIAAPAATGERLTVLEVGRRYIQAAERKGRKRSTLQDLDSHLRVHLEPFFGERPIANVTPEDVQDFVDMLEAKALAPKTVRNLVGTLSALFNFARLPRNRWAAVNPCDGVEINTAPTDHDVRFLTLDELDALTRHARPGGFQDLDRTMYITAAMTGLRRGELLALRWMDVDWLASRVRVRQNYVRREFGTPKSRRSVRSVPLADEVALALEAWSNTTRWPADDDLVFAHPAHGGPLPAQNVTRRMQAALADAGLADRRYVFHDLRHTFGTRMAAAGAPLSSIKAWMGHRSIETTMIYADYAPSGRDREFVAAAFARDPVNTEVEVPHA